LECHFPTGSHKVLPANASTPSEREKLLEAEANHADWLYWGWGFADDEKKTMTGLDIAIENLGEFMRENVCFGIALSTGIYVKGFELMWPGTFCWSHWVFSGSGCSWDLNFVAGTRIESDVVQVDNFPPAFPVLHQFQWVPHAI
jgi:hypothetical protein